MPSIQRTVLPNLPPISQLGIPSYIRDNLPESETRLQITLFKTQLIQYYWAIEAGTLSGQNFRRNLDYSPLKPHFTVAEVAAAARHGSFRLNGQITGYCDVNIKMTVSMQSTIFTTPSLSTPPVALLWLFRVDFNGNWKLPHSPLNAIGNFWWFMAVEGRHHFIKLRWSYQIIMLNKHYKSTNAWPSKRHEVVPNVEVLSGQQLFTKGKMGTYVMLWLFYLSPKHCRTISNGHSTLHAMSRI